MRRLLAVLILPVILGSCASTERQEPSHHVLPTTQESRAGTVVVPKHRPATIPRRVAITSLGTARVVPLELTGSQLVPPNNPRVLGWWGRKAGADKGTTLLIGHTVHTGGGFLNNLSEVPVGASVAVSGHLYTVVSSRPMLKSKVAQKAAQLFSQGGRPKLVIVTCTGYNPATGIYSSNWVTVAK